VWDKGNFNGNYATFHAKIKAALPPTQSPNLFTLGPCHEICCRTAFRPREAEENDGSGRERRHRERRTLHSYATPGV
jgi:hypothetical protein